MSNDLNISIIIPSLNEEHCIEQTLIPLQPFRTNGNEIILCDGGSQDRTLELSRPLVDTILESPKGRATQMNKGAKASGGDIFWFLHADTIVPETAYETIFGSLSKSSYKWGRFDVKLSGTNLVFRVIETMMNIRSCVTGIATGDQGIFISKDVFRKIGGYEEIPLMEDISISKKLKHVSRPACIKTPLITSSRRWEENGIIRTILLMWRLRISYFFGTPPDILVKKYYP